MEFLEDESAFFPAGGISPQLPGLDAFPEESDASEQAVGAEEVLHVLVVMRQIDLFKLCLNWSVSQLWFVAAAFLNHK